MLRLPLKYQRITLIAGLLLCVGKISPPAQAEEQFFNEILELAQRGDGEAQFSLALQYDTGNREKRDPQQAVYWFTQAAAQGIAGASLYLGMKYEFGSGVERNLGKAEELYRQSALKNWPQAAFMLASLLLNTPAPDYIQGCAWMTLARQQDFPGAEQILQQRCSTLDSTAAQKTEQLVRTLHSQLFPPGLPSDRR